MHTKSRREFITAAGAALAATRLSADQAGADRRVFAYVGRRARGAFGAPAPPGAARGAGPGAGPGGGAVPPSGGGITVFRINVSDGSLTRVSETGPEADELNCDGMCVSADGRLLYAVNQTPNVGGKAGAGGGIAAFAINPMDGSLKFLNTQPSMGSNPAGVTIDRTNARVLVANHGAVAFIATVVKRNGVPVVETLTDEGTVSLYPVRPDGSLEPACDVSVYARRPSTEPGPGAAAHQVVLDRTQRWVIASDNGYDHLYVYRFSPSSRRLEGKAYPTPAGRAPRHFAVHPRAPYVFFTNEREASVSSYFFDSNTGEPRHVQTVATILDGYNGPRVAPANIQLHPGGRFLYTQNRGDNSLAMFSVDQSSGRLTLLGTVSCGGRGPREMGIEPSGKYLYECNQQSGDITTFAIDPDTSQLMERSKVELPLAGVVSFAVI